MVKRNQKSACRFFMSKNGLLYLIFVAAIYFIVCIDPRHDHSLPSIFHNGSTMPDNFESTKPHLPMANVKNESMRQEDTTFSFVDSPNPRQAVFLMGPNGSICDEFGDHSLPRHITFYFGACDSDSLGNKLSELYLEALRVFQRNHTFEIICDTESGRTDNDFLVPYFTKKIWSMNLSFFANVPDLCQVCDGHAHVCRQGNNYAVPMIRKTLRQVPSNLSDLDDVTIHLRCGDILQYSDLQEYGYPPYRIYQQAFVQPLKSIGIVSTPINPTLARIVDVPFLDSCQLLLQDMREYLKEAFPHVKINTHTNDSVAQSISRMLHSKQVWCNPSTFCLYPAIASMGHAYILKSPLLYPFIEEIHNEPNIHIIDQSFLSMHQIVLNNMSTSDIILWLRTS
jgi:hypothetical protein